LPSYSYMDQVSSLLDDATQDFLRFSDPAPYLTGR
jgi:hypothetical protein